MTAPVEITYGKGDKTNLQPRAMAFLYRSTRQGESGKDDKVKVVDVPAMTAVSFGMRGPATRDRVAQAQARLRAWLKKHAREYQACGPLRVMGYNSPFVPAERRFTEVEIPVRRVVPAR